MLRRVLAISSTLQRSTVHCHVYNGTARVHAALVSVPMSDSSSVAHFMRMAVVSKHASLAVYALGRVDIHAQWRTCFVDKMQVLTLMVFHASIF
jgi:hypothetical protein